MVISLWGHLDMGLVGCDLREELDIISPEGRGCDLRRSGQNPLGARGDYACRGSGGWRVGECWGCLPCLKHLLQE